jgi:hypothetical protein
VSLRVYVHQNVPVTGTESVWLCVSVCLKMTVPVFDTQVVKGGGALSMCQTGAMCSSKCVCHCV